MNKRELRRIMCAMLLGDGFISKETKTAAPQFGIRHSTKQKEYALWKATLIDSIFKQKNLPRRCRVTYGKTGAGQVSDKRYEFIQINLSWARYLRCLRKRTHHTDNGYKNVMYLLSQCDTPKQLAIWFMDDGSEHRQKKKHRDETVYYGNPVYYLHTCSFTEGQINLVIQWFKQHYDIEPKITRTCKAQGERPRLRFSVDDSRKIFNIIRPYLGQFEFMRNKFRSSFERY